MLVSRFITSLAVCMIFTAFLIVEVRRLRYSAYAYIAQSSLLVTVFLSIAILIPEPHFYIWALSALITKVIIVPWLILTTISKVSVEYEESPILPLSASIIIDLVLIIVGFILAFYIPLPFVKMGFRICLGVSLALFLLGVYGMASKTCAIKQTICLCHMENGIHLLLATLGYTSPVTVEIGILTDAVLTIAIMLYLSYLIKKVSGSLNTFRLSSLRW